MKVDIRSMQPQDRQQLLDLLAATPEFDSIDQVVATEVIDDYLADPEASGYNVHIAEADGQLAGYISFGAAPEASGTWEVYWLAVCRELQGQGIGSRLMGFAEAAIGRKKARLIIIETSGRQDYAHTRRFYERAGYTEVCRIPDFYAPADDKVTYLKRLNDSGSV